MSDHVVGKEPKYSDTMHIILAGAGVTFVLLAVGLGVVAFRKWFRYYSIGTILILLVPATLAFLYVPQVGAN